MQLKQLRGITVLEVIIAIIVFGTGILVILSLLTKNVSWIRDIQRRDTATMLAKEGLEVVYNFRDTNIDKGIVWSCYLYQTGGSDSCGGYFHTGSTGFSTFEVDWTTTGRYELSPISTTGDSWIYAHTGTILSTSGTAVVSSGFRYNHHATGGKQTAFRRYIIFRPTSTYPTETGHILQVESHVNYVAGDEIKSITLESLIGSIR